MMERMNYRFLPELEGFLCQTKWQTTLSIYYGELTEMFIELDHRDKVVMVDETNIASYQKLLKRQRVHIFLARVEGDFEQVRGEILRKDPIPELEECYALVFREDVRRGVMNGQLENSEASAKESRDFLIIDPQLSLVNQFTIRKENLSPNGRNIVSSSNKERYYFVSSSN